MHLANQRGFFDAGLGLALLALFSLAAAAVVSVENNEAEEQAAFSTAITASDGRADVSAHLLEEGEVEQSGATRRQ